jgi:hypothetical protein
MLDFPAWALPKEHYNGASRVVKHGLSPYCDAPIADQFLAFCNRRLGSRLCKNV